MAINLDNIDRVVSSLLIFFGGLYIFFNGFQNLKKKRLIENIPTSKIRSLAMGLVEIYGEVVPANDKILKSPLTNKECVCYMYMLEVYKRNKDISKEWVIVNIGGNFDYFYIRDNTGLVLVNPSNINFDIAPSFRLETSSLSISSAIKEFLRKNNSDIDYLFSRNRKIRLTEYIIQIGKKFYIMGNATKNPFVKEGTPTENTSGIIIQRGINRNGYFIICDEKEKNIVKKLKIKVINSVFWGSLFCIISILMFYYGG